jgi:ribosomal protein S18 acetylase RimI-like enzyme
MDKPLIRDMCSEDIQQVIQMGSSAPELQELENTNDFFDSSMMQGYIDSPDDIAWILEKEGEINGFLLCQFNPYTKIAYLEDVLIIPALQGKKQGQLLLRQLLHHLKGKECVYLWALVHEKNKRMMGFLDKKEFRKGRKFYLFEKEVKSK